MEPGNLERVFERAERVGDAQLAQAVYHEAVERGISSVADRYRQKREGAQQRWERYVAARKASESVEGILASALSSSTGPERTQELGRTG